MRLALLQGQSQASRTSRARTGFNSMYRATAEQVRFVHDERGKPPLPKIPAPLFAEVDPPRIALMRLADRPPQAVLRRRDRDQVDVIGHQAVAPYLHSPFAAPFGHEFHVSRIVSIIEERLLTAVTALGYVVRHSRNDQSRQPCHPTSLARFTDGVNN